MENQISHQDWDTVYIHLDKKNAKKKSEKINSAKKGKGNNLDEVDKDSFKNKKVTIEFSKQMSKHRNAKGLTQKQLAQKINVKPAIINDYETGKAIPNPAILNKIKRTLNI
tara:strand:- start:588 stop:920 length:333 start_codon:yes stop_codon:yes gene_type:complete